MQLVDVYPEHGGSSLQLSMSNDEANAALNQATALDVISLAAMMPTINTHKSPRKVNTLDDHSAKQRRSEAVGHTSNSESTKSHNMKTKEAIPSIDIVSQMWLGFPIHKAIASQRGLEIIQESRINEEFAKVGTPSREIIDFRTFRRAFPHVPQAFYRSERLDAVPGYLFHFTQVPRLEKVDPTTGLCEHKSALTLVSPKN